MAFLGVLPEAPSFGTQLARGLGAGLGAGVSQASQLAAQLGLEKYKQQQRQNLIQQIEGGVSRPSKPPSDEEFLSLLPKIEENIGRELTPKDLDAIYKNWNQFQVEQTGMQADPFAKAKAYAAAGEHELARLETERAKLGEKERIARGEREFLPQKEYIQHASKKNIEYLDKIDQLEADMPTTEFAVGMIEDALGNADKWAAVRDRLAEVTQFPGFRSAAGTELDSAIKNYFLGDLSSIKGGRANQFLEKQIRDAYPKAGQDPISNQKILLGMRLKEKIARLKVEKTRELEQKFIEKQGYLPTDFKTMVNKTLIPEVEKIEKDAINTLHNMSKIQESRDKIFRAYLNPGETLMMDQEGNPFAVKKSEVSMYREQGYIPMGEK
jgi:hypothetical protein